MLTVLPCSVPVCNRPSMAVALAEGLQLYVEDSGRDPLAQVPTDHRALDDLGDLFIDHVPLAEQLGDPGEAGCHDVHPAG